MQYKWVECIVQIDNKEQESANDSWCWCCCYLPTPMSLSSGKSPIFLLVIHQPAHPDWVCPQIHKSCDNGVRMWVQLKRLCMSCVCALQMGHSVCVSLLWGCVIYLFWVGQGCDEWSISSIDVCFRRMLIFMLVLFTVW